MTTLIRRLSLRILLTSSALSIMCTGSRSFSGDLAGQKPLSQFVHDHWRDKDGLPQNGVYSLMQGRDGYIWFGSQEGLVRFDGVHFTVFDRTNAPAMKRTWIQFLREDTQGRIWMTYSTRGAGVGCYDNGTITSVSKTEGLRDDRVNFVTISRDSSLWFIHGPWGATREKNGHRAFYGQSEGLPGDTVYSVSEDSFGNFWFATPQGLARYNGTSFSLFTTHDGLPLNRVQTLAHGQCLFEDSRHAIWFSTDSGVVCYDGKKFRTFSRKEGMLGGRVLEIHEAYDGALWFLSAGGMNSLSGEVISSYRSPLPFEEIHDCTSDGNGNLWIGTLRGLFRFSRGVYDHYGREEGIGDENVNTVMVDSEGSIWFGTDSDGLHRLREGKFITYSSEAGLKDVVLSAVMEDNKGNLWLGSVAGGLAKISPGAVTAEVFDEHQGFPRRVDILLETSDGTMWVGSRDGLFTMRNGRAVPYAIQSQPPFTDPRAFFERRNGDYLLASFTSVYTLKDHRLTPVFPQAIAGGISDIVEDSKGQLWIGTFGNGLFRFAQDTLVHFGPEHGFAARRTYGLWACANDDIWIGTEDNGAYRWRDGTFNHFTPENGFFSYSIANVIEDNAGDLWFTTNKGVYRVRRQACDDVASGKATSLAYDSYGIADGMRTGETNFLGHPNITRTRDGRIVIPTIAGAAIVDPAAIRLNSVPPRVVLERFTADRRQYDLRSAISLAPGTNNLEMGYVGLSYIGADRVQYKYRLEGYEPDWVAAGTRTAAYYTNLRPGDYTFRVLSANADGVWDTTGASFSFEIRPHFYESTWFYALAILGFVFGGPSVYMLRVRQLKAREAELEQQVAVRTRELRGALDNLKETQNQLVLSEKMASLGQLTAGIAHEIKNPLNFITNFASLSAELAKDLRTELAAEREHVDPKRAAEIESLLGDLEGNVNKINEHGRRADSIVRGMLLHSRGKAGERQETDINALLAEYTNLAYHGMRAQDTSFNIKIETDLDPSVGRVNVVPQDLSRAFLNIVNNACYAANDKRKTGGAAFSPVVRVSTKNLGDRVEIRVRDNGNGIPPAILDRIFNPFFTTKPAGAGTGLGLSLSYDIITQKHKGTIDVDTNEGEYTEFILVIPRLPLTEGGATA